MQNYFTYATNDAYPVCFLVPLIKEDEIRKEYLAPINLNPDSVIYLVPHYDRTKKKTPVAQMKEYVKTQLVEELVQMQVEYLFVADSEYFKVLTNSSSAETNLGYVLDSPYGNWKVIYIPNYRTVFYDPPKVKTKINQALTAFVDYTSLSYQAPGTNIIEYADYPNSNTAIGTWLLNLHQYPELTVDIEAFSLRPDKAGIGTISFAWSQNKGIAFAVDYVSIPNATSAPYGVQQTNTFVRTKLKEFFQTYKGNLTYHNISYDVSVLIYQLFMESILDTKGLLNGLEIMLKNWDDTKLITYLATNSCAGNKLSLKDQAQEFAGNYAQDEIKNICNIPLDQLLKYNLIDSLSTKYVKTKWLPKLIEDSQEEIYNTLFKPAIVDIIQMQLTGMPLNMERVLAVKDILEKDQLNAKTTIFNNSIVKAYTYTLNEELVAKKNASYKKKVITLNDVNEVFNPNSNLQMIGLLYTHIGLPVIARTATKQPSTDGDTIVALRNHTKDPKVIELIDALIAFAAVDKILTSFIPAMLAATPGSDGWHYLMGNFNLGGTVSGRLSSSNPNLQTIPSNSKYAKLIKSCFQAPPGWLFCGLDFASLEDKISALTTKDPNKLKVYTDGYDGHSLRTFAYFKDQLPDIEDTVESINSVQSKYPHLRFLSKAPTFALTYQGTYLTLVKNCGFTKEVAISIEDRYKELYKVSIDWVSNKLNQAMQDGYITAAFGLRVRTPLLYQVVRGNSKTPTEAEAEGRTAGNALGQSWCLLNTRASVEFMQSVRASKFSEDIRPCAHIHDAQYMLVRDNIETLLYCNKHLVKAVEWQEAPEIQHPQVKLGGELSVFWPSWQHELTFPNHASEEDIANLISGHLTKLKKHE